MPELDADPHRFERNALEEQAAPPLTRICQYIDIYANIFLTHLDAMKRKLLVKTDGAPFAVETIPIAVFAPILSVRSIGATSTRSRGEVTPPLASQELAQVGIRFVEPHNQRTILRKVSGRFSAK